MATPAHAEDHAPAKAGTEVPAHGAEGGHGGAFPPFDPTYFASQLLWLAITFVVFFLIMKKVALPRIGGILEVRRDRIASDFAEAEKAKQQSAEAVAGYEQSLAEARAKAFTIAETARGEAAAKAADQRKVTEAGLASQLATAEARIADIKSKALAEVGGIAADTAQAIVARLSGSEAARSDVEAAVSGAMAAGARN